VIGHTARSSPQVQTPTPRRMHRPLPRIGHLLLDVLTGGWGGEAFTVSYILVLSIDPAGLASSETVIARSDQAGPVTSATSLGTTYEIFVAFSTTPVNSYPGAVYDSSYIKCQPLGALVNYSPGICPQGKTVAEITEYHYGRTSGSIETRFSASCCQR
jgi:hypothetical protein